MTDLDQARDNIEKIVNQQEYQVYYEDTRNFLQKWWDSVKEWFSNLIADLFNSIGSATGFGTGVAVVLFIVAVLLIVFACIYFLRYRKRKGKYRDKAPLSRTVEKDWKYRDHLAEADIQEDAGYFQLATRHMFLALLLYFHDKEYIEARIWKTNWEYGQELKRTDKDRAESFLQLARIFDEVVYGERMIEKESYADYKKQVTYWIESHPEESEGSAKGGEGFA